MFPQGGPGVALLLLRISVAAIHLLFVGVLLVFISLSIGFLTPHLSVIACVYAIANMLIGSQPGNLACVFSICDAAALALLGPGAYSVDARLFGRRVMVVPPRK